MNQSAQLSFEDIDADVMVQNANSAATFLKILGNENRLMILCSLSQGELSVSELNEHIPLSQSALSQHLAILRGQELVSTRRQSQTIYYSINSEFVGEIIALLYRNFCK